MRRGPLLLAYSASGPYRHVRELLADRPSVWFPWGYRVKQVQDTSALVVGASIELWEVDDARDPSRAQPIALGTLDFAEQVLDWVALTIRAVRGAAITDETAVLEHVSQGWLAFLPMSPGEHRRRDLDEDAEWIVDAAVDAARRGDIRAASQLFERLDHSRERG